MSVVDHFPAITWDNTAAMTLEELRIVTRMAERKHNSG